MPVEDIDAQQVLRDLRSGMKDAQLAKKYHLSLDELTSVFERLIAQGLLSEAEVLSRASVAETQQMKVFQCQSCGKTVFDESDTCPECGGPLTRLGD